MCPAVSQSQANFMKGCEHNPESMQGKCPSKSVAHEFAQTPAKPLPEHAHHSHRAVEHESPKKRG